VGKTVAIAGHKGLASFFPESHPQGRFYPARSGGGSAATADVP